MSAMIPHINSKHYLNALAMHVASEISLTVMIVAGPKNSGKSEGISQMKWMWNEIGHFVYFIQRISRAIASFRS